MTRSPWKSSDWIEPEWTSRQKDVLRLIARSRTNPEIASELGIGFASAKWHVSEVLSQLGVLSREDAAAYVRWRMSLRQRVSRSGRRLAAISLLKATLAGSAVIAAAGLAAGVAVLTNPADASPPPVAQAAGVAFATPTATAIIAANETPTPAEPSINPFVQMQNASTLVISASQSGLLRTSGTVEEAYARAPELMIPCLEGKGLVVTGTSRDNQGNWNFAYTWGTAGQPGRLLDPYSECYWEHMDDLDRLWQIDPERATAGIIDSIETLQCVRTAIPDIELLTYSTTPSRRRCKN